MAANRHAVYGHVARWLIHDLRNPAQALTLITELMDDASEPADLAETIRQATAHLARSLELLDRLLRLPPDGLEPAPLCLADSLRFVAELHRVHRSGVALEVDTTAETTLPAVRGLEHELEQILLNLLLNGLEALRERDGGRIHVGVASDAEEVRVTVADNGPGLAPEIRGRLFEPFVSERSELGHAGVGLAVSRILAERHGGSLACAPAAGSGTCFVLTLPRWR